MKDAAESDAMKVISAMMDVGGPEEPGVKAITHTALGHPGCTHEHRPHRPR